MTMKFRVGVEREEDGRWLAEVPELPGVLAYGASAAEAQAKVQALAFTDRSRSTTVTRSAHACWPASPSTRRFGPKTVDVLRFLR